MEKELYHHGILGQKWGVRRYQNSDGSLTEEGKKRYSYDQELRDRRIYGKLGANRIRKDIERSGASVSAARSAEADRIASARKTASVLGKAAGTAGYVAGYIHGALTAPHLVSKGQEYLEKHTNIVVPPGASFAADVGLGFMVASGEASIAKELARYGGQSVGMLLYGYSPAKYR